MPARVASATPAISKAVTPTATTKALPKTRTAAKINATSASTSARPVASATATTKTAATGTSRTTSATTASRTTKARSSAASRRSTSTASASSSTRASSTTTTTTTTTASSRTAFSSRITPASGPSSLASMSGPSTARPARARTALMPSSVNAVPVPKRAPATIVKETWTEAEILEALAKPKTFPLSLPHYVLLQLGTTADTLQLDTEIGSSPNLATAPEKLSSARSVYFSKQLVNASLAFLSNLTSSSWSTATVETPSESSHVLSAIKTFRIATRFLLLPRDVSSAKQKQLEVETVILRSCNKIKALGFAETAHADCCYLGRITAGTDGDSFGCEIVASNMLLPPIPDDASATPEPLPTRITFLVDLQCSSAIYALETASLSSLDSILVDLNHENGPLAWQMYARHHGGELRSLDRAAFSIERAISKALQRLEAPHSQDYLPLRTLALQMLVQVSDIDLSAFWERVARAGASVLKLAQNASQDIAATYDVVQDTFEMILATAANAVDNSQVSSKIQGEGFQRFCELWLNIARKAGSAAGVERAAAAMAGADTNDARRKDARSADSPIASQDLDVTDPEASSASPAPATISQTNDKDIARFCAILTGSVLTLDKILAGTCGADTQAKLDDATSILEFQIGTWPDTVSMASQLKLYRVLDQLYRRCCGKLSHQGTNSKGQPKPDTTAPANVDQLARACFKLLTSLCKCSNISPSADLFSNPKSTPARTVSLPSKEACLTDIIYGLRVLGNKLFLMSSRSARDEALNEMKKGRDLLQSDLAQSLPRETLSEQLRLLSSSFQNPAGILYNASNYVEAVEFLRLAADCDHDSIQLLQQAACDSSLSPATQQELEQKLAQRQGELSKKLSYTAVSYRFAGSKLEALQTFRQVLLWTTPAVQEQIAQLAGNDSIVECFKFAGLKVLYNAIKAVVDISVHELSYDLDLNDQEHSMTNWLLRCTKLEPGVKGAILEQAAHFLGERSHLSGSAKALSNVHRALLQIYDADAFPLRRARTLAQQLEVDVLSHTLQLSEERAAQMEEEATACLDRQQLEQDEGLRRFLPQYRTSVLLSTALHLRLRKPFEDPQAVMTRVEDACKGLASALVASCKEPATPQASRTSPKAAAVTASVTPAVISASRRTAVASTKSATSTRKPLGQRSAPPQAAATPAAEPKTPPSKTGKLAFSTSTSSTTRQSPQTTSSIRVSNLDRMHQFCQSLLTFHEAFSALALTHCSIQVLRAVRQATRNGSPVAPGSEGVFCRASADLAQTYLGLGKISRADTVLRSALNIFSEGKISSFPTNKVVLVSQNVRFRCLMVQAELLCHERDLVGAQARFSDALKLAKTPSRSDKTSLNTMERLEQKDKQAVAFAVCARLQLARGDLASSLESTNLAVRQFVRLCTLLSRIAQKTQTHDSDEIQAVSSDPPAPSSDVVMESVDKMKKQKSKEQEKEQQELPKFCGPTFTSFFWRASSALMDAYMRLSRLHSVRGTALDAEAFASEGIDFATSMGFALPLARALIYRGELRLQLNQTERGQQDLSRCLEILQDTCIPEAISLSYVQGDCLMRIEQLGEALRSYVAGEATLRSLSTAFADTEVAMPSPKAQMHHRRKSSTTLPAAQMRARLSNGSSIEAVLPDLQSRLLQKQAWTLHLMGDSEKCEEVAKKAAFVKDGLSSIDTRVDQFVLEGRIALRRALEHLKDDHFFSMLPEAAISIPMVPSVSVRTLATIPGSNQAISEETVKTALGMLTPADSAFREALSLGTSHSHSLVLREAFASLAQVCTTQAALGRNVKMAANTAAALLDWASSVSVRRTLLNSVSAKLKPQTFAVDDQEWPSLGGDDQINARGTLMVRGRVEESHGDSEDDEEEALPSRLAKLSLNKTKRISKEPIAPSASPLSAFWQSVLARHQQAQHDPASVKHLLPRNWTVISITIRHTDNQNLVLTRQDGGGGIDGCSAKEAVLYSLPMNRRSQRDGTEEEEEELTLKAAQEKLIELVRLSNDGIHGMKEVQSIEARRQWWSERQRINDELRDLLQAIQDTWLGGFKGVFSEPTSDPRANTALRARFEKIVRRACFPTANKRPSKLKLDDAVFECFAGLPADCIDEDLEDLVHYVMDALQFSGFQVAVDEIDLDETAMDLRGALEEFHGKKAQSSPNKTSMAYVAVDEEEEVQDHHIFLVLDKDASIFPWESMPILRGKAVSRIPSMAFLQDRIEMAKISCHAGDADEEENVDMDDHELSPLQKGKQAHSRSRSRSPTKASQTARQPLVGKNRNATQQDGLDDAAKMSAWQVALRNGKLFSMSKRKTFYLLNPSGDLQQSQSRFQPWLEGRGATHGWKGIIGRQPIVDELPGALSSSDLVLYFGHGGAEQFIRSSRIRELKRCAVTMLWGCSSAELQDNGDFDPTGTPLNYMCAGAPAMVGNLWDMTDRELDSVCEGVFGRLGLMEARERGQVGSSARNIKVDSQGNLEASRPPTEMSLARAVAESRNDCRLPYLTGAATVVYGVPVYWNDH
ncbi:hypothetical protein NDA13_004759 [Ustilago tritici]|nr:hypothetical protein NDA13_004759 [Ustilago tritici]